jgi:hypothetical protein
MFSFPRAVAVGGAALRMAAASPSRLILAVPGDIAVLECWTGMPDVRHQTLGISQSRPRMVVTVAECAVVE